MLRTLIIDDEAHIRDTMTRLLARHCPQVIVVGEASGIAEGIRMIRAHGPDLVLLDINMADGSGFDLLHNLDRIDFKIIFVSACDKGFIQAFKLSGIDYLLKPVHPEELKTVVKCVAETDQKDLIIQLMALEANV